MTGEHLILLVEDDEDIRVSLVELLDHHGYTVIAASHGHAALEHLAAGLRPCLILLDLMMPVLDGRGFREAQLQDPTIAAIPVIVVSAYRDVATHADELGAIAHMRKPIDLDELLRIVRDHCAV